ncbi:nitrite reductase small subunit NirD [Flexivirga sp. ID2601S]|uniref:Nitrite reductase small subunit NirD n=1 Tax=Flexivirga aerilata TaxID=1656889 RepID=A0A849AHW0_9MICO|nr:nitrite reductase small subunit NirD [Flexivirga aerilata]NNG38788.1 nitrite reductase small subunit NirD [Flexivirga aerilata]
MTTETWHPVSRLDVLPRDRAVPALVDDHQLAVVRLADDRVFAVDHRDPFSGAHVIARGIVGSATVDGVEVPTLTSPMFKQVFDLRTGRCLVDDSKRLATWDVRLRDGMIEVRPRASGAAEDQPEVAS